MHNLPRKCTLLAIGVQRIFISVLSTTSVLAQYSNCDYMQNLSPGVTYDVFSPGYPNQPYISGTNCRWRAVAQINYQIRLNCFDMRLPQSNCLDRLEMSWTGTYNDPMPTYACSGQTFAYTSTSNQLVIALRSQVTGFAGGLFRCQVVAQPAVGTVGTPVGTPVGIPIGNLGK